MTLTSASYRYLIVGLLVVPLSACGGDDSLTLTLMADSTSGDAVEVAYTVDDETVTETVESGWRLEIDVSGRYDLGLEVVNLSRTGDVSCRITENPESSTGRIGGTNVDVAGEGATSCQMSGVYDSDSKVTTTAGYRLTQQEADDGVEFGS